MEGASSVSILLTLAVVVFSNVQTQNASATSFKSILAKNKTVDLSWIITKYTGKCYGFKTTMAYERQGCRPVFKSNVICAGTCQSIVYPSDNGLKEFCQTCQPRRMIWERIRFLCLESEKQKVQFAWVQIVDACRCTEVTCGVQEDDVI